MQMFLIREGILDEKGINKLEKQVDDDLQVATDRALQAPAPTPDTVTKYIYSPDLDPTSSVVRNPAGRMRNLMAPLRTARRQLPRPWPI